MLKERLGTDLDALVLRLFPFVGRLSVSPDALTLLGAAFSGATGLAFAFGFVWLAFTLLLVAGFFDLIDGVVARRRGVASSAGAFLDSTVDRVSDLLIFSGIAVGYARLTEPWGVALALFALAGAVLTSYSRAAAERKLAELKLGWLERGERFAILLVGAAANWLEPALLLIGVGACATAIQRILAARRYLNQLDSTGTDPTKRGERDGG